MNTHSLATMLQCRAMQRLAQNEGSKLPGPASGARANPSGGGRTCRAACTGVSTAARLFTVARLPRFRALGVVLLTISGCGSNLQGRVYQADKLHFAVGQAPARWRPIHADGALLAYRDDPADATVAINGRCGKDGDDVALQSLTQHLFLLFTDREIKQQRLIPMDGREAMRTTLTAKLDGVQKAFATYVMKKDGCVYDFLYISRPDTFDANVGQFDAFVAGFHTLRGPSEDP
jgi:hypothetical protein